MTSHARSVPLVQVATGARARRAAPPVLAAIGFAGAGFLVASGQGVMLLVLAVVAVAVAIGLANWRVSLWGLLAFLPVSGIPVILAYPNTGAAVLLKDALFVIPMYVGFVAAALAARRRILFPGAPVALLVLLAVLVTAQAFNPSLPNLLVGAIGLKVWLLYIPLYFVGYHFVRNRSDLSRLLTVIAVTALLPAVIGIVEAILVQTGRADIAYRPYGDAAEAVTQGFARIDYEGGSLHRISSTFSYNAQYYTFAVSMVAVAYAWRRAVTDGTRLAMLGRVLWILALGAAVTSGTRGAFITVPLLVVLILLIERGRALVSPLTLVAPGAALAGTLLLSGIAVGDFLPKLIDLAFHNLRLLLFDGFQAAQGLTWAGLGTGMDTNASRYAFEQPELFTAVDGTWYESWYVKAWLELGVFGLVLSALLFGALILRGLEGHRRLRDPGLRAVSAALLALLVWTMVNGVKGQYVDIDPLNVYFWLFAGVLAKLPALEPQGLDAGTETGAEASDGIR